MRCASRRTVKLAAVILLAAGRVLGASEQFALNWRYDTYEAETPMLANPLKNAKLSVSGQWSNRGPHFITDGKIEANNHWACEELPAVLTIEMQKKQTLSSSHIWFYFGEPRVYKFFIEASADGEVWERVADWTKSEKPATAEGFAVPFKKPTAARFLRVTVTDSSSRGSGAHIVEFQVFEFQSFLFEISPGIHGRNVPTERINARNALGDESLKKWQATAWRNERVHGQFVVWASSAVPQLRMVCDGLRTEKGAEIQAAAIQTRFVRYVIANRQMVGDILDTAERVDLPPNGFRPVWLTVTVPASAKAGLYRGTLTVTGEGGQTVTFPLELEVLDAKLPDPAKWAFFLDLWQHPWAVARYHGVKPFSKEHYQLLEPIYRELANAGQKTLTTTITDLPWGHQNFDAYHTMIQNLKNADGSWSFDYSTFDAYVAFGKKCGIGPQIHCFSAVPWGKVFYTDGASGDRLGIKIKPGSPEYEAYWGPFLKDFQRHLKKKGWVDDTYIAMDEQSPENTKAIADCAKKFAPRLKIAMVGHLSLKHLKDIDIPNYCQFISHIDDSFIAEAKERRKQGKVTTFYICCVPHHPNTFAASPTGEQVWLGYYAAAKGLDGLLRWAFVNWPRDPLFDSSFGVWRAGDTFLLYPGPRSSMRWEMLRDGIEEAEKIRFLRDRGAVGQALSNVLEEFDFKPDAKVNNAALEDLVQRARLAVETATRALP
ncbi:MAG: glycoside hydrolase domain-containing protein [Kiritimatiellia bacterium]